MKRKKLAIICAATWGILLCGIFFVVAGLDVKSLFHFHYLILSWCRGFPVVMEASRALLELEIMAMYAIWVLSFIVTLPATLALLGSYVAPTGVDRPW